MELSFEIPTKYLNQFGVFNDNHFCIAHLVADPAYLSYYRTSNKYKIVDNSSFELGSPIPHNEILKAAGLIAAQEVCAPDVFRDASKTIAITEEFINVMKNAGVYGKYKVMGIVQGENHVAWMTCLKHMVDSPDINVIGISYISCEVFDKDLAIGRVKAVRAYTDLLKARKPIHLLGIGGNPFEVRMHGFNPLLRSCDTSVPIVNGLIGDKFDSLKGSLIPKQKRVNNYFDLNNISSEQLSLIEGNIKMMKDWAVVSPADFVKINV